MKKKRSVEKDVVTLVILIAVVFSIISVVQNPAITGRTVEPTNQPPIWTSENTKFTTIKNEFLILNLDNYFTDPDGDQLTYLASIASNVGIEVSGQQIKLTPDTEFTGERLIPVFASDGIDTTRQIIRLEVLETIPETQQLPQTPAMPAVEQTIKDQAGRTVGKKIEEDYTFDTIITNVEKTQADLIVQFHHNAHDELPIWIEGEVSYHFSKQTALPEETITLTVKLVENGIVPKFKLHVGQTSDVFEFGKTIPEITLTDEKEQVTGHYEIYDRTDDFVDVELTKGESGAALNAVDAEEINAKIGEIKNANLKTEVIAIDPIDLGAATITLAKTGPVTAVRTCDNFDVDQFKCKSGWQITDIPFIDQGDTITFTVNHFSAYVGGTSTNLTIWDDSDFGIRYINTQITFYANFTNATGPAGNTNSTCFIRFNTGAGFGAFLNMTFNATGNDLFTYNRSFATQGTPHIYQVNCTGTGDNIALNDSVYVYQFIPNQGLFTCTQRTGIGCLAGETDVLGISAITNAHAELPTLSNYATRICCADLSGRNRIYANGTPFLNLSNATNAHVAMPNATGAAYNFTANISASNDTLNCSYLYSFGDCSAIPYAGCLATISGTTNAHVSDCGANAYNLTICCAFPAIPLNSFINITKTAPATAAIGTQMTYSIYYRNNGPGTATSVLINDSYPAGTQFINATVSPAAGTNNTWNFTNLTAGQSGTINISLLITCAVANGTILQNNVSVEWTNSSGTVLYNNATANTTALLVPNITITKTSSQDTVVNGSNFTYTITWTNNLCNATNVIINDTYPAQIAYINATPQPNISNNIWLIGNITQGASGTINITVQANATALPVTVTNNVTVTTGEGTNSTAQETITITSGAAPAPTAGGGWAASEGARQYYERQAQEAAKEQTELKCTEKWRCGEWSECINGQKTRTCTDTNSCGTTNFKPGETTPCAIEQPAAEPIGKAVQKPQLPPEPAAIPEQPAQRTSTLATMMPFAAYGLIALLIIILLIYLITEHFIGKKTHAAWTYILYALLALSIIAAALDYFINKDPLWPAVFAIAAIIIVFLLDMLLSWLAVPPKTGVLPPKTEEMPQIKPKKSEVDKDQIKELAKKLKELKF